MNAAVVASLVYLAASIVLTVWVARTLHSRGRIFLVICFHGDEQVADAVNAILVVGFYLINLGYATLALGVGEPPHDTASAIEFVSRKLGFVLLFLGAMHIGNLAVFDSVRRRPDNGMLARLAHRG